MALALPSFGSGPLPKLSFNPAALASRFKVGAAAPATNVYGLSPQEMDAAHQIAASLIDPQISNINNQILAAQRQGEGYTRGAQALMETMAKLQAGDAGAIHDLYQKAADSIAGFSGSLTGELGAAATQAAHEAAARIAGLGAPGAVTTQAPAALSVGNYIGGVLPGGNLAAEAASRSALATQLGGANVAAIGQEALQQLGATQQEITKLRQQGVDIENTRPGEIQKAILDIRAQDVQERQIKLQEDAAKAQTASDKAKLAQDAAALKIQESQLNRAWFQSLNSEAFNRTNTTGTLWIVKGNQLVNTGRPAPGSAAGRAVLSAQTSIANTRARVAATRESTAERIAHDRVMEGLANAKVGISQQAANTASKREQAYERYLQGKTKGKAGLAGMTQSQVRQYQKTAGDAAYTLYYGQKAQKKVDPKTGQPVPGQPDYKTAPGSASDAMKYMIAHGVPYSIAWNAIYQYASQPGSHWADALDWNPKYKPPSQRKKK